MPITSCYRFDRFFCDPRMGWVGIAAVFTALLALAAGCSNNPYPPGESAQSVHYLSWSEDLRTLDPSIAYTLSEGSVIDNIYEPYFRYDHLKETPYVLNLGLGAALPKRESVKVNVVDPKTGKPTAQMGELWTFHIRKGLHFQDDPCFPGGKGREVTAADFLYSWRRMADPAVDCPILSYVQPKVLGFDDYVKHNAALAKAKKPADYAYPVAGLVLDPDDPYAFQIRLVMPYPQLRYLMAMAFTTPIPHEAIDRYGKKFADHPVGCGDYVMTEYDRKQRIELDKNPNRPAETYPSTGDPGDRELGLLADAGKPLPLTDKLVYVWVKEAVTSWNLFQQGYLDSVGVSRENYNQVLQGPGRLSADMARRGIRLQTASTPATYYFAFNMKDPLWGGYSDRSRKLRQAVSLSIDRSQYIDVMLQGLGQPAQSMIPPNMFGYDANYRNPYSRHDVEQAKQLLAQAGYPGGVDPATGQRLTINYEIAESGSESNLQSRLVTQWIEAIGVQVNVSVWQPVQWEERVLGGKSQFFSYGWFADYPDPENFFQLLYGPSAGINYAAYNNPEYNLLFEQMRGMDDGPARLAVIQKMRSLLQTDCPWIFFYHPQSIGISYPWVSNNKPNGIALDGLCYENIDGPRRAAFQAENNRPNYIPIVITLALLVAMSVPAASIVKARRNHSVRRRRPEGIATPSGVERATM